MNATWCWTNEQALPAAVMDLVYLVKVDYTSDCSVLLTWKSRGWCSTNLQSEQERKAEVQHLWQLREGGSKIRNSQPQITKIVNTWISLKPIVFQAYRHSATLNITHPFQQNPETILQVVGIDIVCTGIGNQNYCSCIICMLVNECEFVLVKHETHNYFTGGSSSCMSFSGKLWIMEHGNKKCHHYSNKTTKVLYCGKSNFFIPITCTDLWMRCLSLLQANRRDK